MITENINTLRLKSYPINSEEELNNLIQALEDDFINFKGKALGLSAIQINIPKRVAIIRDVTTIKQYGEKREVEHKYNIWNAEIIEKNQPFDFEGEGCLSIPGVFKTTRRYNNIKVKNGDGEILSFSGKLAVVVLHEMQHWDGILFIDQTED